MSNKPTYKREEMYQQPDYSIGHRIETGIRNRFDLLAEKMGIENKPLDECVYPIESGIVILEVFNIEKGFMAKEGSNIHSWFSYVDYSSNPNFDCYWTVEYDYVYRYYDLLDFVDILCQLAYN